MPHGISVSAFIDSFAVRLDQLEKIATTIVSGVWLGAFFKPEAYITATRQTVAHAKSWSLEQLVLTLELDEATTEGFKIDGE